MRKFTIVLMRDADSENLVAYVPELPGCFTQATTVDLALERVREAIVGHVLSVTQHGEDIPDEPAEVVIASVEVDLRTGVSGITATA
jgi:predicted RNase H-like HicB family nuclease